MRRTTNNLMIHGTLNYPPVDSRLKRGGPRGPTTVSTEECIHRCGECQGAHGAGSGAVIGPTYGPSQLSDGCETMLA
jgi:hypothetical protein